MMYKDLITGELYTRNEVEELFEQFHYEMETECEDLDEYLDEKIKSGDLKEIPQYDVFWVAGDRDGEVLFSTNDLAEAKAKAFELQEQHEDEFDPDCGGIAICDNADGNCEIDF